jgi:hypothetical protein
MQYAWFIWSLIIIGIWLIIYLMRKGVRKEMLTASLWTTPLGLTEPLFVPEYWNPPSLFNLAQKTGFDIESLIFSFAIGGIGSVLYNLITKTQLQPVSEVEKQHRRHRFHRFTIVVPVVVFLLLATFTQLNHIYCGVAGMFAGAITALWCRPDLKRKIWIGGILFTLLYFFYFTSLNWAYPDYVDLVWNMEAITGILILGIPVEEYLFAFTFGMFWSSLYEHMHWFKLVKENKNHIVYASM